MKKIIITCMTVLGVFYFVQTPLLAQSAEEKEMQKQRKEMQKQKEEMQKQIEVIELNIEKALEAGKGAKYKIAVPHMDVDVPHVWSIGGENTTRLTLSKRFNGESTKLKGVFTVEEDVSRIRLQIQGEVDMGMIKLILSLPGGKSFKTLTISPAADMSWSQSIAIQEEEDEHAYQGDWTYEVISEGANGSYHLSLHSF